MKHMDHLAGCLSSEGGTLERHHQDEDFGGQGWVLHSEEDMKTELGYHQKIGSNKHCFHMMSEIP
jgi:hypothetical protein